MKILHHYGSEFNTNAAEIIVPEIIRLFEPKSVIDVGCGIGSWLKVYKQNGIIEFLGIDGFHIKSKDLLIDDRFFIPTDLETLRPDDFKKFDICQCLEVAEHLSENAAIRFIENLTSLSDIIIFSAAVPGQTGENHKNEQPFSYWVDIFRLFNFDCYDIFREKYWSNPKIEWWYKQNMFSFIKQGKQTSNFKKYNGNEYIHPELLKMYVDALSTKNAENFNHLFNR